MADSTKAASTKPAVTDSAPTKKATRTYPYKVSKKVMLLVKDKQPVLPEENTPYNSAIDYTKRIGGAFASSNNPTPLGRVIWEDPDEESRIMSIVLAAQHTHPDWHKLLDAYWNNFGLSVPFDGMSLEVGMSYMKEGDPGTPLNPQEYVVWRYCLKYSRVANVPEDRNKSPKIHFYLASEEAERKKVTSALKLADQATLMRLEILKDDTKSRAVLAVMNRESEGDEADVELGLADAARLDAQWFIQVAGDEKLLDRSFLKACVRYGFLKRPDNSDIYIHNETQSLGNEDETIAYLNDPAGAGIKAELAARLQTQRRGY